MDPTSSDPAGSPWIAGHDAHLTSVVIWIDVDVAAPALAGLTHPVGRNPGPNVIGREAAQLLGVEL
jgi:hypothetical protein